MIIKKWTGSAWEAQAIETTAQSIKTNIGGQSLFDSNNKLYPTYLPDMALAGMRFISTITPASVSTADSIASLIDDQVSAIYEKIPQPSQSVMHGVYWIASTTAGESFTIPGIIDHLHAGKYYCIIPLDPGEENDFNHQLKVEAGDWVIIQEFSGSGTQLDPYEVVLGVINNTYGVMTSSGYGVAKLGYTTSGKNYKVDINDGNLFVNVPWTNTIYTHPNHTGDVTSTGDGATTIAADAVTTAKIKNAAVTNAKLAAIPSNRIKGAVTTGPAVDLTPEQVREIINVADGATANTGTVTSVALSGSGGISITGSPITGSGTITVTNSAPNATHTGEVTGSGVLTITNGAVTNAKLDNMAASRIKGAVTSGVPVDLSPEQVRSIINVAEGATANTGTVTNVKVTGGTGITITGSPITTSGTINVVNSAPNANHTGEVTGSGALTITNKAVTNAKLADMGANTIKGVVSAGVPANLTPAQVRGIIDTIQIFSGSTTPSPTTSLVSGSIWFD